MHRTPELSSRFLTAFAWCDFILSIMRTELPFRLGSKSVSRYLMPDETALRELSEGVIEKLKLLTDAEFAELEFPPD